MNLTPEELNLVRQWYNAVLDLNPAYLETADHDLSKKIHDVLGHRFSPRNRADHTQS